MLPRVAASINLYLLKIERGLLRLKLALFGKMPALN